MFCTNCGAANADDAARCSGCGQALSGTNPYQAGAAATDVPFGRVKNYLVQSILVTLFCCLPFGIVAIVYAAQVDGKLAARDYSGAARASSSAKMWCWISFGIGMTGFALYMIAVIIGVVTGAAQHAH
jgi:hypothetical protein